MSSRGRLIYGSLGLCLGLATMVLAQPKPPHQGHAFAVLVGMQDYSGSGLNELPYASKDTDLFLHHLNSERGGSLAVGSEIQEFVSPGRSGAAKNQILSALSQIVTQEAGANDVVYILITARTEVPLQTNEIYINVGKSLPEKKDSQISLTELHRIMNEGPDSRKIVFAELSASPLAEASDQSAAEIGFRVRQRLALNNLTGVVLAELDNPASYTTVANGGHRVFPYLLVSGLQAGSGKLGGFPIDQDADGSISFDEIRNFMEKYFPDYMKQLEVSHGVVQRFGDQKAADVNLSNLKKPGLAEFARKPTHSGSMLASNASFAGLGFAFSDSSGQDQFPPSTQSILDRFSKQLQLGNLTGEGSARALLDELKSTGVDSHVMGQRAALLGAALRDQGQEQVTRYGTGDRFTVDPKWEETEGKAKDYRGAAAAFRSVLELEPRALDHAWIEARMNFCLGRVAMISGDMANATKQFKLARAADPKFAEALNALGVLDFQQARFEDALKYFSAATESADLWAYPRHNKALAYIESGKYDQALEEYRVAIEKTPYYPYLHYNYGVLLQRLNRPHEAEARYKVALDLFNQEALQARLRAEHWGAAGNTEETERAQVQGQLLQRNIAAVYVALGTLAERGKDLAGAAVLYSKAHAQDADSVAATHNLALVQLALQAKDPSVDLKAIANLLEGNLKKDGAFEPSQLALADTYLRLGRYADAERMYSQVGSGNLSAIAGQAKALAAEHRTSEAIDLVETVKRQRGSGFVSPELAITLGELYQSGGNAPGACKQFRSAVRALDDFPEENELQKTAKNKLKACKTIGHPR